TADHSVKDQDCINYLSDEDSLSLRSTSDSSNLRPHTKRHIESFFAGGEGVVISNSGQAVLSCSAGFSAIDFVTLKQYLITSARCLLNRRDPIIIYHAPWNPPFAQQPAFNQFGIVTHRQSHGVDFTLIEKHNIIYKLNPIIRSQFEEYPSLFIGGFDFVGSTPVGHHICLSGYGSRVSCGGVTNINTLVILRSDRIDRFLSMTRANIRARDSDIGGTVFSFADENGHITVHGIVTDVEANIVAVQPIGGIVNYDATREYTQNLVYIDLETYALL
ncbi:16458_t:CDS:2, partial [Gigaspora margarita]